MTDTTLLRAKRLRLAEHPSLSNGWLRERIVNDPSMLGFGNLCLADEGRLQDGRLELLLRDPVSGERFTVLVRSGPAEDGDLVRALEYWTIERSRYPEHEHFAVVIAEQLPPRFLVAACALGESIPLSVIQFATLQIEQRVLVNFTHVIDRLPKRMPTPPVNANGNGKIHASTPAVEEAVNENKSASEFPKVPSPRRRARRGFFFTMLCLLSLLLSLTVTAIWIRSYQHRDEYTFSSESTGDHVIYSDRGFVEWILPARDSVEGRERYVKIPYWLPIGITLILPIAWLARGRGGRFENR